MAGVALSMRHMSREVSQCHTQLWRPFVEKHVEYVCVVTAERAGVGVKLTTGDSIMRVRTTTLQVSEV
jgi:hypothetical protein